MAASILLVDDDANFRRALRVALSLDGVTVGEATSLDEVAHLLHERHWDCAVVDLLLPCAEGRRVVELLHRTSPHTGVIACSAHPELLRASQAGCLVLEKPFSPSLLLATARPFIGPAAARERTAPSAR